MKGKARCFVHWSDLDPTIVLGFIPDGQDPKNMKQASVPLRISALELSQNDRRAALNLLVARFGNAMQELFDLVDKWPPEASK